MGERKYKFTNKDGIITIISFILFMFGWFFIYYVDFKLNIAFACFVFSFSFIKKINDKIKNYEL